MRRRATACLWLLALVAVSFVDTAHAQSVRVTSILFLDPAVNPNDGIWISSGIRRGLAQLVDVDYVHPVDAMGARTAPVEVENAIAALDQVAAELREGRAGMQSELRSAIEALDANLSVVQRTTLADAYMLRALSECTRRRFGPCDRGFRQVLTFRDGFEYDTTRYPESFAERFEELRVSVMESGQRGSLDVAVEPAAAEVFIDGRSLGPAPVHAADLLVGEHFLTVLAQGYEKSIERVRVGAGNTSTRVTLTHAERALAIEHAEARIREELPLERLDRSSAIVGLRATVDVQRVMFAVVSPVGPELEVRMFVFDLQTRARVGSLTVRVPSGAVAADGMRGAMARLFSRSERRVARTAPARQQPQDSPGLGEQWWFWTAIGIVVVSGAIVTGVIVSSGDDNAPPDGWTRIDGRIR